MGILSRMSRIIKANLNEVLDRAENPEKMLAQCISDMEDSLREAKEGIVRAMADEKKLERQLAEAQEMERRWYQKAQQAVGEGNEALAREALRKRQLYSRLLKDYEEELAQQREDIASLKVSYSELQDKLKEARERRRTILTRQDRVRAESATTAARRTSRADAVFNTRAFDEFDRLANKVEDFDTLTKAQRELDEELGALPPEPSRGLRERRRDEEEVAIDMELAELKKKVGGPPTTPAAAARTGTGRPIEVSPPAERSEEEDEEPGPQRRVEL